MNKLVLILLALFVLGVTPAIALTSYVTCTLHGNYYLCTDGFPNPATNYGTKGIVITGNIAFSSNSGTSGSSGENINLIYNIPNGVEIRDATISIVSGAGSTPSTGTGGSGGNINITFNTNKFKMANSVITISSGAGAQGYVTGSCREAWGGTGGDISFTANAPSIVNNNTVTINLGNGANGYARSGCSSDAAGAPGSRAGLLILSLGLTNYASTIDTTTFTYNGGTGGSADVTSNDDITCRIGGVASSYTTYLNGNVTSNVLSISNTQPAGGSSMCTSTTSGDTDEEYGALGQPSNLYTDNLILNNANLQLKGTPASASITTCDGSGSTYYTDRPGMPGGQVGLYGNSVVTNNSILTLTTGRGGDADSCGTNTYTVGTCGSGGNVIFTFNRTQIINSNTTYNIGANGLPDGSFGGGGSGGVYFTAYNDILFNNNVLSWTPQVGCAGDNSPAYDAGIGSSFYITGGNVSILSSNWDIIGGQGGTVYRGPGGNVYFSGDYYTVGSSNLNLTGGACGTGGTGDFPGQVFNTFRGTNISNSNIKLTKGAGAAVGYVVKITTNGTDSTSIFNNANINLVSPSGDTGIFSLNNYETQFLGGTILNYTTTAVNFNATTNFAYVDNATVNTQLKFYKGNATILRKYVGLSNGTWNFTNSTTMINNTFYQYFARINSITITTDTITPIKSSVLTCDSAYSIYNGSTSVIYEWYNGSTYVNSGTNYDSGVTALAEGNNILCRIRLYDTSFNETLNTTTTIVYAYPYNLEILVNGISIYNYSGLFNSTANVTLDVGPINRYIQYVCSDTTCKIPITVRTNIPISNINMSGLAIAYGVQNISTSTDIEIPFVVNSDESGIVNASNVLFTIMNDEQTQILFVYRYTNDTTVNFTQTVKDSKLNVSIVPNAIDYWDVYPYKPTQQDVQPFGQSSRVPIFNISLKANHSANIYVRFQDGSIPNCTSTTFNSAYVNTLGYIVGTNLTLIDTLSGYNDYTRLWTWTDFNCTNTQIQTWYPVIDFKSRCTECVETVDWDE